MLQIDVAEIVVHEGDEPYAVVDLFDAQPLTGEHSGDVDFFAVQADAAAGGDEEVAMVEGYSRSGRPS